MSRVPIRLRLTGAFALAMVLVLAVAGLFVYLRLQAQLDESVDNALRSRADDVAALVASSGSGAVRSGNAPQAEPGEGFFQLLTPAGAHIGGTNGSRRPVLSPDEARRAARSPTLVERTGGVPGADGRARLLARPSAADGRPVVLVAGASLDDRDETLAGLAASFAIGGPLAVLLASALGYWLAGFGLYPVEAMRRRAERVSLDSSGERLPLPAAHDEIHRLGETLNEMLARLEGSFERERRFVADASHELRTPLAVVKTELEGALRTGAGDPEHREALVAALDETDHLAQLAEDLLLIARTADGQLPVRTETVDVRTLLEQSRERFEDRARAQGRVIAVAARAGLRAELDPLRMRQALGNVVDNALRYGAGTISLRAGVDGRLAIEVTDEGPGFTPALAARAFERFTRGDEGRSRDGTGLGLAIARAVAEAHGGTASIEGATVRFSFPLDSHPHLSGPLQPAAKSTEGG